jgi:quercetin dioxygenase-like cupin family protein
VTVYVVEGAFTLELEGQAPVVVKAGEAYVEPPNVKMTGYNRSTTEGLKVVIFYVGRPGYALPGRRASLNSSVWR